MSDITSKQPLTPGGSADPEKEQNHTNSESNTDERNGVDGTPTLPQSQDYRIFPQLARQS
jgi:hypothetical protein